jgi:hypothetical protein
MSSSSSTTTTETTKAAEVATPVVLENYDATAVPTTTTSASVTSKGDVDTAPDISALLDALRENETIQRKLGDFEKVLERAERELDEERLALEQNNLSFREYLVNSYVMYLKWLADETSASVDVARSLNFCIARHINSTSTDALVMGRDLELIYWVNSYDRKYGDKSKGAAVEATKQPSLGDYLVEKLGAKDTDIEIMRDIDAAEARYRATGLRAGFEISLSLREFTLRLQVCSQTHIRARLCFLTKTTDTRRRCATGLSLVGGGSPWATLLHDRVCRGGL